jgi:hypothetical protein
LLIQQGQQAGRVDRLDQVMVEASGQRAVAVMFLAIAGHCDQRGVRGLAALAKTARQFVAVKVGQADVEDADVKRFLSRALVRAARFVLSEKVKKVSSR